MPNSENSRLLSGHDDVEQANCQTRDASTAAHDDALMTRDSSSQKSISESLREILVERPHPNPCIVFFYLVSFLAIMESLCLLATQIIPIVTAYPNVDYLFVALRCYVSGFCIVFILVELNVPVPFLQNNKAFQDFISRGFLYSFNGLVGLEQAYNARVEDISKHASSKYHIGWIPLFMQLSSWAMVTIGHFYILMGLLCMKQLRDRLKEEYQNHLDEYHRARPVDGD